ncbi:MAG: hypothetical protein ABIP55_07250 [Tepidisphaeraceae bacterium]
MAIPTKDALLVPWANNFSARVSVAGNPYSVSAAQAAEMSSRTAAFVASYNALMDARADGTKAESQTADKDTKKSALLELGRELYAFIAANTSISDADKILVGVHVRGDKNSAVPAPTARPGMDLVSAIARTVTVNIHDIASSTKRRKADGAIFAFVYSFVGENYPTDPTLWQFRGAATKSTYEIVFPDSVASGAQVWICAAWVNRRGETGPVSVPITTNVQGGGVSASANMKIAA